MSAEIINLLTEEVFRIDREIDKLTRQKEACQHSISVYSGDIAETEPAPEVKSEKKKPVNAKDKPDKPKNNYYTPKPKNQPAGTVKFKDYLLKLFSSKPEQKISNAEAVSLMRKAIEGGKIFPIPSKELSANTGAYLWYFAKNGIITKGQNKDGYFVYQFSGEVPLKKSKKTKVIKEEISSDPGSLEEAIMDVIRKEKKITLPVILNKIRLSENYTDISKNLNGTLANCTEDILRDLVAKEILEWNSDNQYCIDKRGDL